MKKPWTVILVIIGLLFLALAVYYWSTPSGSLPAWLPGHVTGSTHKHLKHGLAAAILAVGSWVLAWFMSGSKSTTTPSAPSAPAE